MLVTSGYECALHPYKFENLKARPPMQAPDPQARQWTEDWIAGKRER